MFSYSYTDKEYPEESMEPKIKKPKTLKLVKLDANLLKQYRIDVDKIHQKNAASGPLANNSSGVPKSIVFDSGSKIVQPLAVEHLLTDTANEHKFKFSAEQPSSSKAQDVLSEAVKEKKTKLESNIPILMTGSKVVIARTSVNENRTSFKQIKTESSIPVLLPVRKRVIANNAYNDQESISERICVQKVDTGSNLSVDSATTVTRNRANSIGDFELTENVEATSPKATPGIVEQKVQPKDTQNSDITVILEKLDLIDLAAEKFKVPRDVCISEAKKALHNYNAATHMSVTRAQHVDS